METLEDHLNRQYRYILSGGQIAVHHSDVLFGDLKEILRYLCVISQTLLVILREQNHRTIVHFKLRG